MTASGSLKAMALKIGFVQDANKLHYFEKRIPLSCLTIADNADGGFSATYYCQFNEQKYSGEFGPKGGKKNYAARRIVELLSV